MHELDEYNAILLLLWLLNMNNVILAIAYTHTISYYYIAI